MSVLLQSPVGWLLSHLQFLNSQCGKGKRFRGEYFQLLRPHISGGGAVPSQESPMLPTKLQEDIPGDRKKRKRRHCPLNQGELDALEYHLKISAMILEGSKGLVQEGLKKGLLGALSGEDEHGGSDAFVAVHGERCTLTELCEMEKQLPLMNGKQRHILKVANTQTISTNELDLLSFMAENDTDKATLVHLMGQKYLVPPNCSFLLSDISRMQPLLDYGKKYDVIVLDPPWENKSVKRSNRYGYLPTWQIKQLPVPELAAPNCLVITWVTNRQKHLRFVKEELYPHWSVEPLAEWHWVKITRAGEFVFPLDSTHKKPYEVLILGRLRTGTCSPSRSKSEVTEVPVPDHKLIVSVPCTLHSHKPPLTEVLTEYVKPDAECLELFARNLQTGWTCWGNEVLKFQHIDYFHSLEDGS
ncbi:N(6)-adenine-specific methyltransferase METTL4 [Ambystoma mexicanum]|uniref:N(6)-adenine-specific methyltransferase METTL4 n=1 Tax=Ambystoma mexicanum TaxID=8296 RepID=UPI0037E8CFAB